jgi:hypothetical protein
MNAHADKIQENKNQTASHSVIQKKNSAAVDFQLNDNHEAVVAQMQLLEIANNSEQVKQAVQLQTMVNANSTLSIQKKGVEEEEPLQGKFALPIQKKANNTGLPDDLKSGIENLSGFAMDDVKVHYNSPEPAQLQAHAYAQGTDIHIASGQEKHLPHEAWHVVQQKQGRVQPTLQMKGNVNVNDDAGLENEADVMGEKALQMNETADTNFIQTMPISKKGIQADRMYASIDKTLPVQRKVIARIRTKSIGPDLPRIISELRIEGRAPTTVKNAQGDHTVAETLINESVKREVMNQQPKIALNNLVVLAQLTLPDPSGVEVFYSQYWGIIDEMEGEDKNTVIEEMIQTYIELANKREATAYLRDEELTRGNKGERKAIGGVRELADKLENQGTVTESDLILVAKNLTILIDIKFVKGHEDKYLTVVTRAIQHAVLSVLPQLNKESIDFIILKLAAELGKRDGIDSEGQSLLYNIVSSGVFHDF